MDQQDLKLLTDWFDQNQDHKLNFIEKEAIKLAVKKASTVGDLLKTGSLVVIPDVDSECFRKGAADSQSQHQHD